MGTGRATRPAFYSGGASKCELAHSQSTGNTAILIQQASDHSLALKVVAVSHSSALRVANMLAAFTLVALCAFPENARAQERCPGLPVEVTAETRDELNLVCLGASDAIQMLQRCDIYLRRPLNVYVVDEARHPLGRVVAGFFDPISERILVSRIRTVANLFRGTPYEALPAVEFYRSLNVHEIVHAIMHHNFSKRSTNHSVYEYPAYALQIASLPPAVREKFLQSVQEAGDIENFTLNDIILSFDPYLFAARAYRHFSVSSDGCGRLRAILSGKVDFIAILE